MAIFNALTRLLVILVLWLMLPILVENVVYRHINNGLLEKKQKFIQHLDRNEIDDFIENEDDSTETYSQFSTLHSEFLVLSKSSVKKANQKKAVFTNEYRIIEGEENEYRILQYHFTYDNQGYQLEIGSSLGEVKDLTFIIRFFIIIVFVVILLITFLADTFYIEYLLKPFYKIIDTKIRRVNEPEAFDHTPIKARSRDFRELDFVLNQMMDRIAELFKKEKQFISNVSHELLTPIALLKNKFENLLQNDSLDDNAFDKIAGSLRTLDMLKKIINNLLLISRIENNQYEANEEVNFHEIVTDLQEDLQDRIDDREIQFLNKMEHDFSFTGNKTLIHILIYNLVTNAIKYNKPNGSIIVTDGFVEERYFISIADSGIGMNASQIEKIFSRFARISSDQEGQGLGLAIADSIASFHHIEIKVSSAPDEGTTFVLLFPEIIKHN
ncbi:Adaptive-response sensory-kinase SasA [Flavobacterium bizetiae]|uniref:histidine kinase n=1 Tax=Flavobacterium bizetiae TaxID=2704140 RepID=A0A6J4GBI1_9FLAO|nr:Adaptive-response sensory-kinase SasA [Flavobacterium bizetiae]CAD5340894.1 Adaptive-response sensory-kinase SasA [Flavobacterium bizetiae]CAD5347425.1 Adaptive-response sensory-kinase SasA [Flavobacterium bizetiae]